MNERGQNLRDIKRRIRSFQNTKQITKAMEMVAAAKLRRAQERAEAARPYAEKMREVIVSIAASTQGIRHPMLETRPIRKTGYCHHLRPGAGRRIQLQPAADVDQNAQRERHKAAMST